ncbi:ASCH domain-containing protein [Candidatus Poriferisodalis sp.]|uniref:ASCH domain-containing protein n=1 Tax=Candidatus Poriferisodalis sp. TaxID=3101277 RepID=UPI003B011A13
MAEDSLDPSRALVLSLKPRFAEAILAGTKIVEVRRVMPRITDPTLALLYASGSERALVGTCVVRSVAWYPTDELWRRHGADTALSRTEFDSYLDGRDGGVALLLERPEPLAAPIPLHTLRQAHGFRPPQSFAYVCDAQRKRLLTA